MLPLLSRDFHFHLTNIRIIFKEKNKKETGNYHVGYHLVAKKKFNHWGDNFLT